MSFRSETVQIHAHHSPPLSLFLLGQILAFPMRGLPVLRPGIRTGLRWTVLKARLSPFLLLRQQLLQKLWICMARARKFIICCCFLSVPCSLCSIARSIELSDEAGEVIVLEESGEEISREGVRIPDNEAVAASAPRNNTISTRIIHHFISLDQEWRRPDFMKPFHRLRRRMEIREKALWKVLEFLMGWERRSGLDSLDMVEEWDGTTHMVAKEWLWFSTQVYEI
nr:hypothetical protein Iba_chr12fCG14320 [Ipomoea batatas]